MSYATIADMQARFPTRDLVDLTDASGNVIQDARIQAQLDDASDIIDSYIASRYALPLNYVPQVLTAACADIAMYRIQALRPLHDIADARKRFEDWLGYFVKVATGQLGLGYGSSVSQPALDTNGNPILDVNGNPVMILVPGSGLSPATAQPNVILVSDDPRYGRQLSRDLLRDY